MSITLDSIRNKNQKRRTLEKQYEIEDSRRVPHYDDEAKSEKVKSLKRIASDIKMANAGVDRDILFLDKICVALAQQVLASEGIAQPEGNSKGLEGDAKKEKDKEIGEYWAKVESVVDRVGADIYTAMDDENKPFGWVDLADGESRQKTVDGAIVEAVDEKNKKPKGKRASKVTTKRIEDDGSEAEAASECVTSKEGSEILSDERRESTTSSTTDTGASSSESGTSGESASSALTTSTTETAETKSASDVETNSSTSTSASGSKKKAPLSLVPKNNKKAVK